MSHTEPILTVPDVNELEQCISQHSPWKPNV